MVKKQTVIFVVNFKTKNVMKEKYPFILRLLLGVPLLLIASIFWAIIWLFSTKSLAIVLRKTSDGLLG